MIGDPRFLPLDLPYVVIDDPAEAKDRCATALPILTHPFRDAVELGHPSLPNANDVVQVLERAVQLVQQGLGHALCTAPIAKSVLQKGADFKHPDIQSFWRIWIKKQRGDDAGLARFARCANNHSYPLGTGAKCPNTRIVRNNNSHHASCA